MKKLILTTMVAATLVVSLEAKSISGGAGIDSDWDGILNIIDFCPKTPFGVNTDHRGCEITELTKVSKPEVVQETKVVQKDLSAPANLGILFETNSAKIKSSDMSKFKEYSDYLINSNTSKVIIEAHTDSDGTEAYNLQLSKKRAASAKTKLMEMGVISTQIDAIGYGEAKPLVPNTSASNKQQNRRVTARIVK